MIENSDFETFLYISKSKYQIYVYDKNNLKSLYNEEVESSDEIELNILSQFLDCRVRGKKHELSSMVDLVHTLGVYVPRGDFPSSYFRNLGWLKLAFMECLNLKSLNAWGCGF